MQASWVALKQCDQPACFGALSFSVHPMCQKKLTLFRKKKINNLCGTIEEQMLGQK